ncbi:hypothetical protein [Streptomyces mirabilis]|uniref:hypothetical protein n=1 Tax=Streptomyces mirabilis TaxID=68239 RepID=UPI0036D9AAA8
MNSNSFALPVQESWMVTGVDPAWCPAWGIDWQRGFHLTFAHVRSCGALPVRAGEVLAPGEDLGTWTMAQRVGWDALTRAQQWMLDSVLGLEPAGEAEQPPARRTQADRWAGHLAAARQFHAREGHLKCRGTRCSRHALVGRPGRLAVAPVRE